MISELDELLKAVRASIGEQCTIRVDYPDEAELLAQAADEIERLDACLDEQLRVNAELGASLRQQGMTKEEYIGLRLTELEVRFTEASFCGNGFEKHAAQVQAEALADELTASEEGEG